MKGLFLPGPGAEPPPLRYSGVTGVIWNGRKLTSFSGCDYYRLSRHPEVLAAFKAAVQIHGLSVSASRMTTGSHELYMDLEMSLSCFFESETALLMPTGYVGATAAVQALSEEITHAVIDEQAHVSLFDASSYLQCPVATFRHADPNALAVELRKARDASRVLLLTDGMFARDGSAAPLRSYKAVLPRNAIILVDDAHGAGVLGPHGRGTLEHERVPRKGIVQTITLSKAFGCYGGAVLCDRVFRRRLLRHANVFTGSTPIPLPIAAAAIQAIKLLVAHAEIRSRLRRNADYLRQGLSGCGHKLRSVPGPIVRLDITGTKGLSRLADALVARGIFPPMLRYLNAPPALRFVVSSAHTRRQLNAVVAALTPA